MSQWRSRAFQLTRDRTFLLRVASGIIAVCTLISVSVLIIRGKQWPPPKMPSLSADEIAASNEMVLGEEYQLLRQAPAKEPARVMKWLMEMQIPKGQSFDPVSLKCGEMDLAALFRQHAGDAELYEALAAYARFRFDPDEAAREKAQADLAQISLRENAPRHANELYAESLLRQKRMKEVLGAWMREWTRFPDATLSRRYAFELALQLKDASALQQLCSDKSFLRTVDALGLRDAAQIMSDRQMLFQAMARMTWERWMQGASLFIALFTAGIWYVILVYTASRERFRWFRFLPAVFAGIVSVTVLLWFQETVDYRTPSDAGSEAPTLTHAMMDWILNVGLPEEAVKALLFAFFLPVLLHNGSPTKAALVGGCVGLGFALDENLLYFSTHGSSLALGRFLTANFLHIGLTGILGWGTYELFRSRFHKATEFLTAFLGVTLAHGLYDFTAVIAGDEWGMDIMHVVILAAVAAFYLRLLHSGTERPAGWVFSRTSIFIWGISLLVGVLMIAATYQMQNIKGITETLSTALSLAVIGFIFLREFREV
ncbi:protease prsW family protein [Roseimicrobium gellanilyticum]|uniref:Protease prsW family protein n=1 Tax=Roseimicrobium gellanilyticum TaxID=748857 RepID=A0A366HXJ0_9BACT|nr:PrsW family glutamic-type intramembrane protease [Roseimicrobium gellanilyticum]RBP48205.1 protease prsW family protein [Roseimicrobium gellanilyticum]